MSRLEVAFVPWGCRARDSSWALLRPQKEKTHPVFKKSLAKFIVTPKYSRSNCLRSKHIAKRGRIHFSAVAQAAYCRRGHGWACHTASLLHAVNISRGPCSLGGGWGGGGTPLPGPCPHRAGSLEGRGRSSESSPGSWAPPGSSPRGTVLRGLPVPPSAHVSRRREPLAPGTCVWSRDAVGGSDQPRPRGVTVLVTRDTGTPRRQAELSFPGRREPRTRAGPGGPPRSPAERGCHRCPDASRLDPLTLPRLSGMPE